MSNLPLTYDFTLKLLSMDRKKCVKYRLSIISCDQEKTLKPLYTRRHGHKSSSPDSDE